MCKVALVLACLATHQAIRCAAASAKGSDNSHSRSCREEPGQKRRECTGALTTSNVLAALLLRQAAPATRPRSVVKTRLSPVAQEGQGFAYYRGGQAVAGAEPSTDWELDFYSRPVQGANGKKLWELLVTDATSSFRYVEPVAANCVNSRELRSRVQRLIDGSDVKPTSIRFFRSQMKNMINIGLQELQDVEVIASRTTYALLEWLDERERDVYPSMPGYSAPRPQLTPAPVPTKLPNFMVVENFDFVTLPLAEFLPGGSIDASTVPLGRMCPLPVEAKNAPKDTMVYGLILSGERAEIVSRTLMGTTDLAAVTASRADQQLYLEANIDTTWLLARLDRDPVLLQKAQAFEESKSQLGGLHFLSINDPRQDDPTGFWLMRALP